MPTQPFRRSDSFKKALKLIDSKCKSVISLKNLHRSNEYIFKSSGSSLKIPSYIKSTNRQFIESNFTPCGCFYIVETSKFLKKKSIYIPTIKYIVTTFPNNLDIDLPSDLKLAILIFNNKKEFNL